jgi:hypothetical protein
MGTDRLAEHFEDGQSSAAHRRAVRTADLGTLPDAPSVVVWKHVEARELFSANSTSFRSFDG